MHKGFDALFSSDELVDIDALERKYETKLPESFKVFARSYKLGKNSLRKEPYWDEKSNRFIPLITYTIGEGEMSMGIDEFSWLEDSIAPMKAQLKQSNDRFSHLMQVAYTADGGGGGIFISLRESDFGHVYKVVWDTTDNDPIKVADDIFGFVSTLTPQLTDAEEFGINYEAVYKNWNEDFWRSR